MSVTPSEKRYIITCASCNLMFESERKDQLTCSAACRVKAHRNGSLEALRKLAATYKVRPGKILQAAAADTLGLGDLVMDGDLELDGDPRVSKAFNKLVLSIAESSKTGVRS